MENTKTPNYTQEQTLELVQKYKAGTSVEDLANLMGRSTRSVVAKLSREGVYQSKQKAQAAVKVTKLDLIKGISTQLGLDWQAMQALEAVDKQTLLLLKVAVEQNIP